MIEDKILPDTYSFVNNFKNEFNNPFTYEKININIHCISLVMFFYRNYCVKAEKFYAVF
jgi:hypothetical protein